MDKIILYPAPLYNQKEEIKSCEERVKNLLEMIPPKGKEFLQSIEHILEREKNWVYTLLQCTSLILPLRDFHHFSSLCLHIEKVWWKRDGCPAFEKQPFEKKSGQAGARKRCATCFLQAFTCFLICCYLCFC